MRRRFSMIIVIAAMMAVLIPHSVFGEDSTVRVNTSDAFKNAVESANSTDTTTIVLEADIALSEGIAVDGSKKIILDLNGNTLSAPNRVLAINSGYFEVVGPGEIKEEEAYYAPIVIKGSSNQGDTDYTTVKIGEGVTLEGWSGVFITPYQSPGAPHAYGVTVDIDCIIKSVTDTEGSAGHGVYINGQIKNTDSNYPVFNIGENAVIESEGTGVYAAGYAEWNIDGADIRGDVGIALKSGKFFINDAVITGTGEYVDPIGYNGNGIDTDGSAMLIDSNKDYAGNVEIAVSGNTVFNSENSKAISEFVTYNPNNATSAENKGTNIISFSIEGGVFNGADGREAVKFSDEAKAEDAISISAGTFSSEPDEAYIDSNTTAILTSGGVTTYLVGPEVISSYLENGKSGDVLEITSAAEGTEFVNVPDGIKIENATETDILINGQELKAGESLNVSSPQNPSEPADQPSDKPQQGEPADGKAPETGDDTNLGLLAGIMLTAAAAGAAAVALRRKGSKA